MSKPSGEDQPRYAKGDRVWVRRGHGLREPGVVIGYYIDWGLYRVVYMVDTGQGPRAMEEWRLSPRGGGDEC
jgi:hypothetical protein